MKPYQQPNFHSQIWSPKNTTFCFFLFKLVDAFKSYILQLLLLKLLTVGETVTSRLNGLGQVGAEAPRLKQRPREQTDGQGERELNCWILESGTRAHPAFNKCVCQALFYMLFSNIRMG